MILSGIYRIKNNITGDCYVGSSNNINRRFSDHRRYLRTNCHINKKLQNSYNKYGEDAFKYEIFEICPVEYLLEREQERLDTGAFSLNICLIAGGAPNVWNGKKHSEESKAKMSAAQKGNTNSKGNKHSAETKAKMRVAHAARRVNQ